MRMRMVLAERGVEERVLARVYLDWHQKLACYGRRLLVVVLVVVVVMAMALARLLVWWRRVHLHLSLLHF